MKAARNLAYGDLFRHVGFHIVQDPIHQFGFFLLGQVDGNIPGDPAQDAHNENGGANNGIVPADVPLLVFPNAQGEQVPDLCPPDIGGMQQRRAPKKLRRFLNGIGCGPHQIRIDPENIPDVVGGHHLRNDGHVADTGRYEDDIPGLQPVPAGADEIRGIAGLLAVDDFVKWVAVQLGHTLHPVPRMGGHAHELHKPKIHFHLLEQSGGLNAIA